jgi:diacylglycerol kinase family enzyme
VNVDGELIGRTPLDGTVRPHALTVFVPAPQ